MEPSVNGFGSGTRMGRGPLSAALVIATSLLALAPGAGAADQQTAKVEKAWDPGPLSTPYGDYLAARHAEAINDAALAAKLLERTLKHVPDDPELLRMALNQSLAAGYMDRAVDIAKRYLEKRPNSVFAKMTLAVDEIRAGRLDEAQETLKSTPNRGLGGYVAPLALAWTYAGKGRSSEALEALEPFGKRRGLTFIHDLHAAMIHDLLGETEAAEKLYDKITSGDATHLRLIELAGAFFERHGKPDKARAIYEALLKRQSATSTVEEALARVGRGERPGRDINTAADGVAEAFWDLAILLNDQSAQNAALMLTRLALHARPKFELAQIMVGDILAAMNRNLDAVAAYDKVDPKTARGWEARLRAADALTRAEQVEPALERLKGMAGERPERYDAVVSRGDILRFRKRFEEAIDVYDEAFKRIDRIEQRHWSLHYSRGIALERSKQWERAEADFLAALRLLPNQPYVLNYLGYSWVDKGLNLKRALGMIETAVRLRPNDGFIVDSLGWAHYRLGNYPDAVRYLERAIVLSPSDSAINDHLGDAYWRVGRRTEARFQWWRALKFEPEPETVPEIKKKLDSGLEDEPKKTDAYPGDRERNGG